MPLGVPALDGHIERGVTTSLGALLERGGSGVDRDLLYFNEGLRALPPGPAGARLGTVGAPLWLAYLRACVRACFGAATQANECAWAHMTQHRRP